MLKCHKWVHVIVIGEAYHYKVVITHLIYSLRQLWLISLQFGVDALGGILKKTHWFTSVYKLSIWVESHDSWQNLVIYYMKERKVLFTLKIKLYHFNYLGPVSIRRTQVRTWSRFTQCRHKFWTQMLMNLIIWKWRFLNVKALLLVWWRDQLTKQLSANIFGVTFFNSISCQLARPSNLCKNPI